MCSLPKDDTSHLSSGTVVERRVEKISLSEMSLIEPGKHNKKTFITALSVDGVINYRQNGAEYSLPVKELLVAYKTTSRLHKFESNILQSRLYLQKSLPFVFQDRLIQNHHMFFPKDPIYIPLLSRDFFAREGKELYTHSKTAKPALSSFLIPHIILR